MVLGISQQEALVEVEILESSVLVIALGANVTKIFQKLMLKTKVTTVIEGNNDQEGRDPEVKRMIEMDPTKQKCRWEQNLEDQVEVGHPHPIEDQVAKTPWNTRSMLLVDPNKKQR